MKKQAMMVVATVGLVQAACSSTHESQCSSDTSCNLAPGGRCATFDETGNRWCQYPDPECPNGMRWSDFETGDGLSGECVAELGADAGVPDAMNGADASTDAGTPDAGTIDADVPPDADMRTWQPPELLENVNTAAPESMPDISPDGLDLYFTGPGENTDIFVASRASTANDFSAGIAVTAVNSAGQDWAPQITSDNLELYFFRLGVGLMVSKRTSPGSAWGTPAAVGVGGQWADHPTTTGDGLTLYFVDTQTNTLYRSVRASKASSWETPESVSYPGVAEYRHVDISSNGLGLLLSNPQMLQNTDVVVSWKQDVDDPWTSLEVIPSLLDETLVPRYAAFNETMDEIYIVQDKSSTNFMDTELWVTRKE